MNLVTQHETRRCLRTLIDAVELDFRDFKVSLFPLVASFQRDDFISRREPKGGQGSYVALIHLGPESGTG